MARRWSTGAIGLAGAIAAAALALPGSALAAAATATAPGGASSADAHTAIVGGSVAAAGTFPWLALVEYNEGNGEAQYCSGTVVASNVVLTAGHCVANIDTGVTLPASSFTVFTGDVDWTAPTEQASPVTQVLTYPGFDPSTGYGDAGVLVLATATTAPVIPLATPADESLIDAGSAISIAGWGATSGTGGLSDVLESATIGVQTTDYCNSQDGADSLIFDPSSEFCAIDQVNYASGTCHGDSGGPAIVTPTPTSVLEVGIVSRADAYCRTVWPDIFTRVDLVSDWVSSEIAAVAPSPVPAPALTGTAMPALVAASPPPAPASGKYLASTHQRDGHVYTTIGPGGVTRINVRFDLHCGKATRGPLTTTEVFADPPKLVGLGGLWHFSTLYTDSAGRRYDITGAFPASGAATTAAGTLEVTTGNRRCTSGTVHWSAAAP